MARARRREAWSYFEHTLKSAAEAVKGEFAAIELSSGLIVPAASAAGLLVIGTFEETKTGTGSNTVRVRLSKEIWVDVWDNDAASDDVGAGDIGSFVYIKDSTTVTTDDTTTSVAGRAWKATTDHVWVESILNIGPQGPQGEAG